jgi:hypothetical protein
MSCQCPEVHDGLEWRPQCEALEAGSLASAEAEGPEPRSLGYDSDAMQGLSSSGLRDLPDRPSAELSVEIGPWFSPNVCEPERDSGIEVAVTDAVREH